MKEIHPEIEIKASAERVWQLLTDFVAFPQWNPFIHRTSGELKTGARLEVYIQPSGAKGMSFKPMALNVEPNRELRWRAGYGYTVRLPENELRPQSASGTSTRAVKHL